MHSNTFRYFKPKLLVTVILILGTLISMLMGKVIPFIFEDLGFNFYQWPATGAILIPILVWIDKKLWKFKPFSFMYSVPNMSGRYEGKIKYKHPETNISDESEIAIEVIQTGSKTKINSYIQHKGRGEASPSKSLVESVIKNDDDTFSIVCTFRNYGIQGVYPIHEGTNILNYINNDNGKFLKGIYYTNRQPQTKGEVDVKFSTNKLKHDH